MLSGTPLFEGIDDLRGELNFLNLEPFGARCEDGFFGFMITQPWDEQDSHAIDILKVLSSVMLRRSKTMTIRETGAPILGLPPLTIEFVPIAQTESERALYCFLESIVSQELRSDGSAGKNHKSPRLLCLRLLRDICNSAVLLNGGLGAGSQLKDLNQLLIKQARRVATNARAPAGAIEHEAPERNRNRTPVMSCDEAIMHLAQLQEATRTGEDEVAGMAMGFGQGLSRRVRASDTVEQKLAEAEQRLQTANSENQAAKSRRAKARWHVALERITMGGLPGRCVERASAKFRALWRLRSMAVAEHELVDTLPTILRRGWRPAASMVREWHKAHPEFFWSHPVSFVLEGIPAEVSLAEVGSCVAELLLDKEVGDSYSLESAQNCFTIMEVGASAASWRAALSFSSYEAAAAVLKAANHPHGLSLAHDSAIPAVQSRILQTKAAYNEARALESVRLFLFALIFIKMLLRSFSSHSPFVLVRFNRPARLPLKSERRKRLTSRHCSA